MMFSFLYFVFVFLLVLLYPYVGIAEFNIFVVLNVSFSLFVCLKLWSIRRIPYFFINPIVLVSIFMFLLANGFPYLIGIEYGLIDTNVPSRYLIKAMVYTSVVFIFFWHIFFSKQIRLVARACISLLTKRGELLKSDYNYNYNILYFLFGCYIVATLIDIHSGSYGYLSVYNDRSGMYQFASIINLFSYVGYGVVLLMMLIPNLSKKKKFLLWIFFCVNLFFQLLSGFKGAVIRAVLVLFVGKYLVEKKVKSWVLIISVISVSVSYAVIEPYRAVVQLTRPEPKTVSELVQIVANGIELAFTINAEEEITDVPSYAIFLSRFSTLYEFSSFIEYKERYGLLEGRDPDFVYRLLTIPMQVFVPQVIWKNKPIENLGSVWVNDVVMGRDNNNSLAFGPFGFLYCTGGLPLILIGFCFLAVLVKMASILLCSNKLGAVIISIVMIAFSYTMEVAYNAYIVPLIRFTLIAIVLQYFIIRK